MPCVPFAFKQRALGRANSDKDFYSFLLMRTFEAWSGVQNQGKNVWDVTYSPSKVVTLNNTSVSKCSYLAPDLPIAALGPLPL